MGQISVSCVTKSLDEYKRLAEIALSIGATHMSVSQVEPAIWLWNSDRYDPYPNWSLERPSIFKFIVPETLKQYLPQDYAKRNLEMLAKRSEILQSYGLKGTFNGIEPAYLPEQAYLDHPNWRGPRCDQPRRARKEYYAPCIDDEEMYRIYVQAIRDLCKVAPFESFNLLTNDSGGGLCWASGLYPGKNGPMDCENGNIGDRIVRFLTMFQEGARLAGFEAKVNVWHIADVDAAVAIPKLKEGQSVNNQTATTAARKITVGYPLRRADYANPVTMMPRMVGYAEMMQQAQKDPSADIEIGLRSVKDTDTIAFLQKWFGKLDKGPLGRYTALQDMATDFVGKPYADILTEIWQKIENAVTCFSHYYTGGHIFCLGTVHQRWLTRPLVAFPEELTEEEKSYYRPFQFQAQKEEDADNLLDLQANRWLSGVAGQFLYTQSAKEAMGNLKAALAMTVKLRQELGAEHAYANRLKEIEERIRMYQCVIINAQHVIKFQFLMDNTDRTVTSKDNSPIITEQGDQRLATINQIVRDEINNTHNMIKLLENTDEELLYVAPSEEKETVMIFGPDLIGDFKKKIAIMEEHRRDFLRFLSSYNR